MLYTLLRAVFVLIFVATQVFADDIGPKPFSEKWNVKDIPYYMANNDVDRMVVLKAVKYLEENTCLRFRYMPIGTDAKTTETYINIEGMGRCGDGPPPVMGTCDQFEDRPQSYLRAECCDKDLTALHELAAVLGFPSWSWSPMGMTIYNTLNLTLKNFHPYNQYVDLTKDAIPPSNYLQFLTYKDQVYQFSFLDVKRLNEYFNCNKLCSNTLNCENDGFQNVNNCQECVCPTGFGGPTCAIRAGSDNPSTDNGATLEATPEWQILEANFTTTPSTWWITAHEGKHVEIKMVDVRFIPNPNKLGYGFRGVCYPAALILKLENPVHEGFSFCDEVSPKIKIPGYSGYISKENRVILHGYDVFDYQKSPYKSQGPQRYSFMVVYRIAP